ncbi:conjugal transfer protein TrbL [Rickettsiales bacterium Ac37b]|nr:conjugal transfer protein TrbL [Rickettsiales bacterium Ac37b]
MKNVIISKVWFLTIIIIALLLNNSSYAAEIESGILDNILDNYQQASINWFAPLFNLGQKLFALLAAIEIAWCSIIWVLERDEFTSFTSSLIKKIMSIGFFYALLLNANSWIPAIVDSFIEAGQLAGGVSDLSPSAVLDTGLKTSLVMLSKLHFSGLMDTIATGGTALVASIIIIFSFAVIASQLLIAIIESYIVISGGIIFLGFGGSRWTTDFTSKYISYAFAIGVKLFILYLLIGIGQNQVVNWPENLEPINVNSVLSIMGSSLVYMFLVWQIPSMAASMLSGAPNMTAGSAASTIASSANMMVSSAAKSGAFGVGAAKSGIGLSKAASSAWQVAGLERLAKATNSGNGIADHLGQVGSAVKHFTSSSLEDSKGGFDYDLGKTKGGRMSSILGNRMQNAEENIAANSINNNVKHLPPSLEQALKNIASNANRNSTPHDNAHTMPPHIKLNHTES